MINNLMVVNFKRLVEKFLVEEIAYDTNDQGLNKGQATNLQTFLGLEHGNISSAYNSHYNKTNTGMFGMISSEELKQLGVIVADKSLRSTKGSQFYPKMETTYPLLGLLADLAAIYKRGSDIPLKDKPKEAVSVLESFYKQLEGSSPIPLDFQPVNVWAQSVKQDFYSKQQGSVGLVRLSELPKEYSIYGTIKHLLHLRQEATAFKYPKEKIPDPKQFIADIFLKPNFYIKGEKAVPSDQKIKDLYDETTSNMLVGISTAAYELFKQQALSIVGIDEATKKPKLANEEQAYAAYIGATFDQAAPFKWTQFTAKELMTNSFKMRFDSLYKNTITNLVLESGWFKLSDGKNTKLDTDSKPGILIFTVVDKKDGNAPDPNYKPIYITIKELENIYNTNEQVKKEVDEFIKIYNNQVGHQQNQMITDPDQALYRYFSSAKGKNSTEEKTLDKEVQKILQQRLKDELLKRKKDKTSSAANEPAPGEARFFEIGPNTGEYLYSLGNVEKFQREVPPAGELYKRLEGLADFLKKEVDIDWRGAMQDATSALRGLAGTPVN